MSKRLETIAEDYNEELVKERVRQVLNKDEYGSIFGCTITNTVISESSQGSGNQRPLPRSQVNELMQRLNLQPSKSKLKLCKEFMINKQSLIKWRMTGSFVKLKCLQK